MPRKPLSSHVRVAPLGGDGVGGDLEPGARYGSDVCPRCRGESVRLAHPCGLCGVGISHPDNLMSTGDESTEKRP